MTVKLKTEIHHVAKKINGYFGFFRLLDIYGASKEMEKEREREREDNSY